MDRCVYRWRMDGGWMDDGWEGDDGWMNGCMDRLVDRWMNG